jgi:methylenetetrahydrofolate dehydrogenase (NADP+)/methenyltetrahydrofolate cyclohydrolase
MDNIVMYGKPVADKVKNTIKEKIAGKKLTLGIMLVGDDQASHLYMERLAKNAQGFRNRR